jgi:hypothetical protein
MKACRYGLRRCYAPLRCDAGVDRAGWHQLWHSYRLTRRLTGAGWTLRWLDRYCPRDGDALGKVVR